MANVTFHRTSKQQETVKRYLVEIGKRTQEEMDGYKGVVLGDDNTVILTRKATSKELEIIRETVKSASSATICEVYATFGGRVKLVDRFAELTVKVDVPEIKETETKTETETETESK